MHRRRLFGGFHSQCFHFFTIKPEEFFALGVEVENFEQRNFLQIRIQKIVFRDDQVEPHFGQVRVIVGALRLPFHLFDVLFESRVQFLFEQLLVFFL